MPTPVGHSLWSVSMYLFFRRKFRDISEFKKDLLTILLCLIIGLLPDADLIFFLFNGNPYAHRSISHSILVSAILMLLGGMFLKRRQTIRHPFLLSFSLIGGHVFWDFFTKCDRIPYGTMFFWPFSHKYYPTTVFIFPGFDWITLRGMFSINLVIQTFIELIVFVPLLLLALFIKTKRNTSHESRIHQA